MKKNIDISDEIMEDLQILAIKEKRRGKTDPKNFIEDLIVSYVGREKLKKNENSTDCK